MRGIITMPDWRKGHWYRMYINICMVISSYRQCRGNSGYQSSIDTIYTEARILSYDIHWTGEKNIFWAQETLPLLRQFRRPVYIYIYILRRPHIIFCSVMVMVWGGLNDWNVMLTITVIYLFTISGIQQTLHKYFQFCHTMRFNFTYTRHVNINF